MVISKDVVNIRSDYGDMPKNQFTADKQPSKRRTKSFKTKLLNAIRENALLEMGANAKPEEIEAAFLSHVSARAFNPEDMASSALLKELLSKSYSSVKATMPEVEFDFPENGEPKDQAAAVMKAIANGDIPPDVGQIFISSIKSMLDIEEITDLKARIEQLEELIGAKSS